MANSPSGDSMLDRIVRILDSFDPKTPKLSVAALARRAQIPRATMYRLIEDLVGHGLLARDHEGQISLGLRLWELANRSAATQGLRKAALPFMPSSGTLSVRHMVHFPSIEEALGSNSTSPHAVLAREVWGWFQDHLDALLDSIRLYRFDQFEMHVRTFWSSLTGAHREVVHAPAVAGLMAKADAIVYDVSLPVSPAVVPFRQLIIVVCLSRKFWSSCACRCCPRCRPPCSAACGSWRTRWRRSSSWRSRATATPSSSPRSSSALASGISFVSRAAAAAHHCFSRGCMIAHTNCDFFFQCASLICIK